MKSAPGFMTVNRLTVNPDLHLGVLAAVASLNWRPIRTLTLNRVGVVCRVCVCVCVCKGVCMTCKAVPRCMQSRKTSALPFSCLHLTKRERGASWRGKEGESREQPPTYQHFPHLPPPPLGHLPPPGTLLLAVHFIHFVVHIKCLLFSLLLLPLLLLQTVDRLRRSDSDTNSGSDSERSASNELQS